MSTKLEPTTLGPLKSGDTIVHTIPVLDDSDVAKDLTGATIKYQYLRRPGDTAVVDLSTADSPETVTLNNDASSPPVKNTVIATVDKSLTAPLNGTYLWEAEATDVQGQRATIGYGHIIFERDLIE